MSRLGIVHRAPSRTPADVLPPHVDESRKTRPVMCPMNGAQRYSLGVTGLMIGYARVSTDEQDLAAQLEALAELGVGADRIYVDKGLTGTNRSPGRACARR